MKNVKNGMILVILMIYTFLNAAIIPAKAEIKNEAESTEAVERVEFSGETEALPALSEGVEVGSRILELFFGNKKNGEKKLIPGGEVFGVKIKQNHVSIAESKGIPALSAGDIIISINGKSVSSAEDVRRAVAASGGESVTIRAKHNGADIGIEARPILCDGEYKLGLTLRDGAAGIGTITFIDPETATFGGLGHGICDGDTGDIVDMQSGVVCEALLGGVHKGEVGKPGELTGIIKDGEIGSLIANNECGVFGVLTEIPNDTDAIPIASKDEITEGEATIISTIKNNKTQEYKIEIYDIDLSSSGSKSFRIRVTDETLKALTGGIVRGMSGSPIIQDGKLVGAVTHVMVADPTEGYGIFIENMLNAAESQVQPKAA